MTGRRAQAATGFGALLCIACCLWPFAIVAIAGAVGGFLVSPVGWLVVLAMFVLAAVVIVRHRRRREAPVPVALTPRRERAQP